MTVQQNSSAKAPSAGVPPPNRRLTPTLNGAVWELGLIMPQLIPIGTQVAGWLGQMRSGFGRCAAVRWRSGHNMLCPYVVRWCL